LDDRVVTFDRALTLGVRHFEHALTIPVSVLSPFQADTAVMRVAALFGAPPRAGMGRPGAPVLYPLELWRLLGDHDGRGRAPVGRLARAGRPAPPTVSILGQRAGLAGFATPATGHWGDFREVPPAACARGGEGYRIMAGYVAQMDQRGIHLAVGSDTQ